MKVNISLAEYNDTGAMASLEMEGCNYLEIAGGISMSAKKACASAAKSLREAAARFEMLAGMSDPFNATTQRKVNRQSIRAQEGK